MRPLNEGERRVMRTLNKGERIVRIKPVAYFRQLEVLSEEYSSMESLRRKRSVKEDLHKEFRRGGFFDTYSRAMDDAALSDAEYHLSANRAYVNNRMIAEAGKILIVRTYEGNNNRYDFESVVHPGGYSGSVSNIGACWLKEWLVGYGTQVSLDTNMAEEGEL